MNEPTARVAVRRVVGMMVGRDVADSERLVSGGIIDSLAVVQLVVELERALGIAIPTDRLQPDDFDSVDIVLETLGRVATKCGDSRRQ